MSFLMKGTPYVFEGSKNAYRMLLGRGITPDEAMRVVGERSRDNGRTPMQWTAGPGAGFTTGEPWLGVPANHEQVNAEAEVGVEGSMFEWYRGLIALRHTSDVVALGDVRFLDAGSAAPKVIAFERTRRCFSATMPTVRLRGCCARTRPWSGRDSRGAAVVLWRCGLLAAGRPRKPRSSQPGARATLRNHWASSQPVDPDPFAKRASSQPGAPLPLMIWGSSQCAARSRLRRAAFRQARSPAGLRRAAFRQARRPAGLRRAEFRQARRPVRLRRASNHEEVLNRSAETSARSESSRSAKPQRGRAVRPQRGRATAPSARASPRGTRSGCDSVPPRGPCAE